MDSKAEVLIFLGLLSLTSAIRLSHHASHFHSPRQGHKGHEPPTHQHHKDFLAQHKKLTEAFDSISSSIEEAQESISDPEEVEMEVEDISADLDNGDLVKKTKETIHQAAKLKADSRSDSIHSHLSGRKIKNFRENVQLSAQNTPDSKSDAVPDVEEDSEIKHAHHPHFGHKKLETPEDEIMEEIEEKKALEDTEQQICLHPKDVNCRKPTEDDEIEIATLPSIEQEILDAPPNTEESSTEGIEFPIIDLDLPEGTTENGTDGIEFPIIDLDLSEGTTENSTEGIEFPIIDLDLPEGMTEKLIPEPNITDEIFFDNETSDVNSTNEDTQESFETMLEKGLLPNSTESAEFFDDAENTTSSILDSNFTVEDGQNQTEADFFQDAMFAAENNTFNSSILDSNSTIEIGQNQTEAEDVELWQAPEKEVKESEDRSSEINHIIIEDEETISTTSKPPPSGGFLGGFLKIFGL